MNPGQSVKDRAALFIIQDAVSAARCGRAARSSRAPPATPASASPWSAMRWASARSSSSPRPRARRRRTRCACSGAELVEVPARALQEPQQLREIFARLAARLKPSAQRRHLGQPVRQRRQPPRPTSRPRPRRSGPRPTARSTASSPPSARAARWAASPTASRPTQPQYQIALADPHGRRALQLLHDGRARRPRAPPSPRASARAASPRTSRARSSTAPI